MSLTKLELQELIGKRVELIHMDGEESLDQGDKGEVVFIDDINQVHIKWDNGSSLAIIPTVDEYKVLTPMDEVDDLVGY